MLTITTDECMPKIFMFISTQVYYSTIYWSSLPPIVLTSISPERRRDFTISASPFKMQICSGVCCESLQTFSNEPLGSTSLAYWASFVRMSLCPLSAARCKHLQQAGRWVQNAATRILSSWFALWLSFLVERSLGTSLNQFTGVIVISRCFEMTQ